MSRHPDDAHFSRDDFELELQAWLSGRLRRLSPVLAGIYAAVAILHWAIPPVALGPFLSLFALGSAGLLWLVARDLTRSPSRRAPAHRTGVGIAFLAAANLLLGLAIGVQTHSAVVLALIFLVVVFPFTDTRRLLGLVVVTTTAWAAISLGQAEQAWQEVLFVSFAALVIGLALLGLPQSLIRSFFYYRWRDRKQREALVESRLRLEATIDQLLGRSVEESGVRPAVMHTSEEDALWDWDVDEDRFYFAAQWFGMLGYDKMETEGTLETWLELVHPDDADRLKRSLSKHLSGTEDEFFTEYRVRDVNGGYRWVSAHANTTRDARNGAVRLAGSQSDVSDQKRTQAQLIKETRYDSLTGLANLRSFRHALELAVARLRRSEQPFSVLLLGLDRFRDINDSFGHSTGDQLLIEVGRRIARLVRPQDTVARIGGDEFAVLLSHVGEPERALSVAERVQEAVTEPTVLNGLEVVPSAGIGLSIAHLGDAVEDVIQHAAIALNRSKNADGRPCQIFDQQMQAQVLARLQLEADLRRAIDRDELRVHYQPIVSLADETVVGFEALVRWQHPDEGLLGPGHFLELAEETGVIIGLGGWIINRACRQLAVWQDRYPAAKDLFVSVNVSNKEFAQFDFESRVREALAASGLSPSSLWLEMTETVLIKDPARTAMRLSRLKDLGIKLAIDDFGTGYSSLSYLARFPFDVLKIDRSFLMGDESHLTIIRTILDLGKNLGLSVVAEGIEKESRVAEMRDLECEFAQGYYFARPMPAEEAEKALPGRPRLVFVNGSH